MSRFSLRIALWPTKSNDFSDTVRGKLLLASKRSMYMITRSTSLRELFPPSEVAEMEDALQMYSVHEELQAPLYYRGFTFTFLTIMSFLHTSFLLGFIHWATTAGSDVCAAKSSQRAIKLNSSVKST
jgi:hypothetical protein